MSADATARQLDVLRYVAESIDRRGLAPTIREIGAHTGIGSTNGVVCHLSRLERHGLLRRKLLDADGAVVARGLRVTPEGRAALGYESPLLDLTRARGALRVV